MTESVEIAWPRIQSRWRHTHEPTQRKWLLPEGVVPLNAQKLDIPMSIRLIDWKLSRKTVGQTPECLADDRKDAIIMRIESRLFGQSACLYRPTRLSQLAVLRTTH